MPQPLCIPSLSRSSSGLSPHLLNPYLVSCLARSQGPCGPWFSAAYQEQLICLARSPLPPKPGVLSPQQCHPGEHKAKCHTVSTKTALNMSEQEGAGISLPAQQGRGFQKGWTDGVPASQPAGILALQMLCSGHTFLTWGAFNCCNGAMFVLISYPHPLGGREQHTLQPTAVSNMSDSQLPTLMNHPQGYGS